MAFFNWSEKRIARRLAKQQLATIRSLSEAGADLPRKELYRRALMEGAGCDADRAAALVTSAERGISWWPHERDLDFREVVHQLAVSEYAEQRGNEQHGTTVVFRDIIDRIIPADL